MDNTWVVYMLRCADETLYTGITNNIERRLLIHNSSKQGAKYTKIRRPVTLVYLEKGLTRSEALKREAVLKRLPRKIKLGLIVGVDK